MTINTTVLGYPRIGERRQLKTAVEDFWAGRRSEAELQDVAADIRRQTWTTLAEAGIDLLPSNTFSFYDHVLDTAVAVDAVPARHRELGGALDTYFAMARGTSTVKPLELTKWFDTNYHHLVPELHPGMTLRALPDKPLAEYREAKAYGWETRPVMVGPATLLLLSKPAAQAPDGFTTLDMLDATLDAYAGILAALADEGVQWVQFDEPAFTADRTAAELGALRHSYLRLGGLTKRPKILVTASYGHLGDALAVLTTTDVEGIGIDLVTSSHDLATLEAIGQTGKTIAAGVVDGRNVWPTSLTTATDAAHKVKNHAHQVWISTSCSLLHLPYDVTSEADLPAELHRRPNHDSAPVHASTPISAITSPMPTSHGPKSRLIRLSWRSTHHG